MLRRLLDKFKTSCKQNRNNVFDFQRRETAFSQASYITRAKVCIASLAMRAFSMGMRSLRKRSTEKYMPLFTTSISVDNERSGEGSKDQS